jgi:hypothetical protein
MEIPAYHFEGSLVVDGDQEYINGYIQCPFEVPAGVGALRLRLKYDPLFVGSVSNLITLGLFDPHGFRGNAHRHPPDEEVILSTETATVGFVLGPIHAGAWLAQLALQAIVADVRPCTYTLDIELLPEARPAEPVHHATLRQEAVPGRAGWFHGELHSHTIHSDGSLALGEVIAEARRIGLDFLAVTDHNTTTALAEIDSTALDGLLLIPGLEFTTFSGHALALGIDRWIDWRTGYNGWTMEDAARQTRELGGLFIIAHPNDIGSPTCTGCRWEYQDFDLDLVDAFEIWNEGWPGAFNSNLKNLQQWQSLQSGPRRLPATCGGDFHDFPNWGPGKPFSYIYATQLSIPAVLEGIRQGRVFISCGPWLSLQVSSSQGGEPSGIGDTCQAAGGQVNLSIGWEKVPSGSRLVARSKQSVLLAEEITGNGSRRVWIDVQSDDRIWLELYAEDGLLLALTNPVFIALKQ